MLAAPSSNLQLSSVGPSVLKGRSSNTQLPRLRMEVKAKLIRKILTLMQSIMLNREKRIVIIIRRCMEPTRGVTIVHSPHVGSTWRVSTLKTRKTENTARLRTIRWLRSLNYWKIVRFSSSNQTLGVLWWDPGLSSPTPCSQVQIRSANQPALKLWHNRLQRTESVEYTKSRWPLMFINNKTRKNLVLLRAATSQVPRTVKTFPTYTITMEALTPITHWSQWISYPPPIQVGSMSISSRLS